MGLINDIGSWMLTRMAGSSATAARDEDAPGSPTCQVVGEDVYEDDMIEVQVPASSHVERYGALIDSFDEDREPALEKVVRWVFLVIPYLLPVARGVAMGK